MNINISVEKEVNCLFEQLLQLDKKNNHSVVSELFQLMKVSDFSPLYTYSHDKYVVDLSSLEQSSLLVLHQMSDWQYPSYFLRKKMLQNWNELTEEELLFLLQIRSVKAKQILFERYEGNYEKANDELLVLMAQQGNNDALDKLIERYYDKVKQMSYWLVNKYRLKDMDAKDMAHEGIIGLYKAVNDYKIQFKTKFKDFSKFVIDKHIGTIRNTAKNHKNRALNNSLSYHTPLKEETDATFEDTLFSETYHPEDMLLKKEEFYDIWDSLTKLERSVLILYGEGLKYDEIAIEINKDRKAVDNTIQRIKTKGERYRHHNFIIK